MTVGRLIRLLQEHADTLGQDAEVMTGLYPAEDCRHVIDVVEYRRRDRSTGGTESFVAIVHEMTEDERPPD